MTIGAASTFFISAGNYAQSDGTTTVLSTGTLDPAGLTDIQGGTLLGTGTINSDVTNAGQVSPGLSPGILTINGNYAGVASGMLDIELNGTSAGTQYDQLKVNGTVDLTNTRLNASRGFDSAVGDTFTILDNDGADAVTGTFSGLAEGGIVRLGVQRFQITYAGGDGNDVVLTHLLNRPPMALPDSVTFAEDPPQPVDIDVLANDSSPDAPGETLTVTPNLTQPAKGSASLVLIDGRTWVRYVPRPNENGDDFFTYEINDALGGFASAPVHIYITPVNDPPELDAVYVNANWASLPTGVDPDGGGPANAIGFDAFPTINQGVARVATGGQVLVAAGSYDENVRLTRNVRIAGAAAATVIVEGGQRDSVFRIEPGVQATVSDLTIQHGRADQGGGLYNQGIVSLRGVVVRDNSAALDGGGAFNKGTFSATTSTFSSNAAVRSGGALANVTTRSSVDLNLAASTFRDNHALVGGGLDNFGPAAIDNCTFDGNGAVNEGGAIHNAGGPLTITNSTLSANQAFTGGAVSNAGRLQIANCTLSGNSAEERGGGIYNAPGGAPISLELASSTLTRNQAETGGGVYTFSQRATSPRARNTIVAGNVATVAGPDVAGAFVSLGHNLIGIKSGSVGFVNRQNGDKVGTAARPFNPRLGPLQDNGGPTFTHALLLNSPAIDAGDNNNKQVPANDQRGARRIADGNNDGIAQIDIGAFELVPFLVKFSIGPGTVPIDGFSVDTVGGQAPAGLLLTVTSTLGTIVTDDDLTQPGTQVPVQANGTFSFAIRRPTVAGTPLLTGVAVDGSAQGSVQNASILRYQLPTILDYGDAPASYGTQASNDGARHGAAGPLLGTLRDSEADGIPRADALGDDRAGVDDEDGVVIAALTPGGTSTATVTVTTPAGGPTTAFLDAWIHFNGDGDFLDAGERITPASGLPVTVGSSQFSFAVPVAGYGGQTYARFRLSTVGGLGPTGLALNGEVEDYAVTLLPSAIVYVDDSWAGLARGVDPDGPARSIGYDAFATVQEGLDHVAADGTVNVADGLYFENLSITANVHLVGSSVGEPILDGRIVRGLFVTQGTVLTVERSASATVSNFTLRNGDGGVFNLGTLTLSTCTISNNGTTGPGGGVYNLGTMTINDCTISGNDATRGGGVFNEGTMTINRSTVSANTATRAGGGIANVMTMTINSSTLSGNAAARAGGGIANQGTLALQNSTITANTGRGVGGLESNRAGTVVVHSTIIAGNRDTRGSVAFDVSGAFTSRGYNFIGAGDNSTGFVNDRNNDQVGRRSAPLDSYLKLGPLQDNGGPTFTHALLFGSRALDRGDNFDMPATDQRGQSRLQDGNGEGLAWVDIGAFEAAAPPPPSTVYVDDDWAGLRFGTDPDGYGPLNYIGYDAFARITDAVNRVADDGTVIVRPGTYVDNVVVSRTVRVESSSNFGDTHLAPASGRAILVTATGTLSLSGLDLIGSADKGGGIANYGTLGLSNSQVTGTATMEGGGLYNEGTASIYNSTLQGDSTEAGGAIANRGTLSIRLSSAHGTAGKGGGIANFETLNLSTPPGGSSSVGGTAKTEGGGLYNEGTATSDGWDFTGGAPVAGGGVSNRGTLEIANAFFSGQHISGYGSSQGGGIFNAQAARLKVQTSQFEILRADAGTALFNAGEATVEDTGFRDNTEGYSGAEFPGSPIENSSSGTLTVQRAAIFSNRAFSGGGILNLGTLTLLQSDIQGNEAHLGSGGGLANLGTAVVSNTIFAGNFTTGGGNGGGGVYNGSAGDLTLINCTVVYNEARGESNTGIFGGGVLNSRDPIASGSVKIGNTLIAFNDAGGEFSIAFADDVGGDRYQSLGNNWIRLYNNVGGGGDFEDGRFADHVGYYFVIVLGIPIPIPDPGLNPHLLNSPQPGADSPLIDAGNNTLVVGDRDALGNPRVVDGDGNTVANVDIGAIEV